jgi:hypothetical protein
MKTKLTLAAMLSVGCGSNNGLDFGGQSRNSEKNDKVEVGLDSGGNKKESSTSADVSAQNVDSLEDAFTPPGVAAGTPHYTEIAASGSFVAVTVICGTGENAEKKYVELTSPLATEALLLAFARTQCSAAKPFQEHYGHRAVPPITIYNWMYVKCNPARNSGYLIRPANVQDPNWVWLAGEQKCRTGVPAGEKASPEYFSERAQ